MLASTVKAIPCDTAVLVPRVSVSCIGAGTGGEGARGLPPPPNLLGRGAVPPQPCRLSML